MKRRMLNLLTALSLLLCVAVVVLWASTHSYRLYAERCAKHVVGGGRIDSATISVWFAEGEISLGRSTYRYVGPDRRASWGYAIVDPVPVVYTSRSRRWNGATGRRRALQVTATRPVKPAARRCMCPSAKEATSCARDATARGRRAFRGGR
jgi:hypothetical protein